MPEIGRRFVLTPQQGSVDDGYYRISDFELATGWVGGFDPVLPFEPASCTPREGFEAALVPALQRTPCVIAFSGGRDSSAILAVATHVARREGLPDPIPATHDFGGNGRADETGFQELLIKHLGLRDWYRFAASAGDVLGAPAQRGLQRQGLLWPARIHCQEPMIELAAGGGSLVFGEGGDEVLGKQRMSGVNKALQVPHRPGRRTLRMLTDSLAPASERRRRLRRALRGQGMLLPYLRRDVAEDLVSGVATDLAAAPLRWDRGVIRHTGRRAVTAAATNLDRICANAGVTFHKPFLDPTFLGPFASAGGWRGWVGRTEMMRMLFGDVVPEEICRRTRKAEFGAVAFGAATRAFLVEWQGEGVDPDVVDIDAFRAAATAEWPPFGAQMLVQAAWLATQRDREPAKDAS